MSGKRSDPNIKLPRQIMARVEAGEDAFKAVYAPGTDGDPGATPGTEGLPPNPVLAIPDQDDGGGTQEEHTQVRQEGGDGFSPPSPPTPTPPPIDYEARYNTLRGKYDAEMREMRDANAALSRQLADLSTRLTVALTAPSKAPEPPPQPEKDPLEDNFDQELVQFIDKRTGRHIAGLNTQLLAQQTEIASLKKQLQNAVERTNKVQAATFEDRLDDALEGWREQNTDPEFLKWLGTIHPDAGEPWGKILDNAVQLQDVGRCVRIFRAFPGTKLTPASPAPAPTQDPPRRETRRVATLDTMLVPPRGRQVPIEPSSAQAIITSADAAKFTADVAKGRYRDKPAEQKAMEAAIDKAIAEGRYQFQPKH